jgi:hypothetical protein
VLHSRPFINNLSARFFLFGMGSRRKLLYKAGQLLDALTLAPLKQWQVLEERVEPAEYRLGLSTQDGEVVLEENETGVWLEDRGKRELLTEGKLCLPDFAESVHRDLLRVLHHEVLINIVSGKPLPNFFVYDKPWYRDAATMAMVLEQTDNLHLIEHWIGGLREPFDRNNAGHREPDNLGQLLYLISLVVDRSHPLVDTVLSAVKEFQKDGYIVGLSDFAEHPVYQTKWFKFGLKRLGLEDNYSIPAVYDSYSSLFWMGYREQHVNGPRFSDELGQLYPYLTWAEAHFHTLEPPLHLMNQAYPLSWEAEASQANYSGMTPLAASYVTGKRCVPHTWHAGEMFLYFIEQGKKHVS